MNESDRSMFVVHEYRFPHLQWPHAFRVLEIVYSIWDKVECRDDEDYSYFNSAFSYRPLYKQVQYVSLARNLLDNNDSPVYPKGTIFKEFPLNGGSLSLEATLNKAVRVSDWRINTTRTSATPVTRIEARFTCSTLKTNIENLSC